MAQPGAQSASPIGEVKLKDLSASNSGLLTLSFSEPMKPLKLQKVNEGLMLYLDQATSVAEDDLNFTWEAKSATEDLLMLQITFDEPLAISCEGRFLADKVRVAVIDGNLLEA